MKIELLFSTANKGKYLYKGEDISTAIRAMLDEVMEYRSDDEYLKLIKTELNQQNDRHYWTWERITEDWELSPEFAESLKPLDFVYPRTFMPKTKLGEAFIELIENDDSVFMMIARTWIGTDTLRLEFILCHLDHRTKLLTDAYAGKLDF